MNELINKITPGNYWLTKSMEFNRVQTSGTLWYLKKWLVYYYYIFMKENIYIKDYNEIKVIFNNYIDSLPEELRDSATNFFFKVDIREVGLFNSYQDFINDIPVFNSPSDEREYRLKSKKFYFLYLMNIGGQAGYKKFTKELVDNGNAFNSTLNQVKSRMLNDGETERRFKQDIEGDYTAAIRNERQIYFYYGLFHGKDSKSLQGFYNLTPVGKSILKANFHELIILWEHQKIKMISQSPVSDIQNLKSDYSPINFSVNNHPYYTLLHSINTLKGLDFDDYMYGLSRTNNRLKSNELIDELSNHRHEFIRRSKARIDSFGRRGDSDNTDFKKELKKYLLGVYDLKLDSGLNPYSFLRTDSRSNIFITNQNKLCLTLSIYDKLIKHLNNTYLENYINFEKNTFKKYQAGINEDEFILSNSVRYDWSKYNINLEKGTILFLIYWGISCNQGHYNFNLTNDQISSYFTTYKSLISKFGYNKADFTLVMKEVQNHISISTPLELEIEENNIYVLTDPSDVNVEISIENLRELSERALAENDYYNINRKRSSSLIRSLKTYYYNNYKNSRNLIPCECCSENTFINTNHLPYLEFHHLIPFSTDNGPDHYLNLYALCSNCHSKMHHLHSSMKPDLYNELEKNNLLEKTFVDRLETLYSQGFLEAIHLDYLLKENIINNDEYEGFMSRSSNAA
ncbi:HNH endonuclease [Flavobacteriaceae bacterium]|nr:HNH endonuclease [Flavobacteriaceae bacterium]|tara:strand:- start:2820 stop:4877 length:2058 start_codon:yes stop_codon:yes gene_type:complete